MLKTRKQYIEIRVEILRKWFVQRTDLHMNQVEKRSYVCIYKRLAWKCSPFLRQGIALPGSTVCSFDKGWLV